MAKTDNLNLEWKTDRKDLIEAVRTTPSKTAQRIIKAHMRGDPRAKGLSALRQEQQANLLMVGILEGKVPESAVLPCAP